MRLLRLLVVLCALLGVAEAQVAFQAATTGETVPDGATSFAFNVPVSAGSSRAVIFCVCADGGVANDITVAQLDGINMTPVADLPSAGSSRVHLYMYSVLNPATGTLSASFTFGTTRRMGSGAIVLTGVDQTTPTGTPEQLGNTGASSISRDVATITGDMIVDAGCKRSSDTAITMTAASNRTERYAVETDAAAGSSDANMKGSTRTGNGTLTMEWTQSGSTNDMAIIAVNVKQVSAAPTARSPGFLLLQKR